MSDEYILQMKGIVKRFPGVLALNNVSLNVRPATVHALMGENGAGKSTLMKCLFGIYRPDDGEILFKGTKMNFSSAKDAIKSGITMIQPRDALGLGVTMIHQELVNVPYRTVAQNIWLGREPLTKWGLVDYKEMNRRTEGIMKNLGLDIKPTSLMASLSISEQQTCEIAKAVSADASFIVMDEPTSSLSEREVEHLFQIIENLKKSGVAIIYISHRMEEIFKIADEISVMRDGSMVGTYNAADMDEDKLINLMIGRVTTQRFPAVDSTPGDVCMSVEHLSSLNPRSFQDVSFTLRRAEILGVGGLVGAQRSELVEAIFGLRSVVAGKITINGKEVVIRSPKDAIKNGLGLITEDRRGMGLFPLLSITQNTSIASLDHYLTKAKTIDHRAARERAVEINKMLSTKTPTMETPIQNLSGGNQQKVIVSRWLMTVPDILIMDEPTRGIDVGAKYEIYTIMADLVKQGKSIIMVSSEMPELLGMSQRIMVLCNGKVTGTLDKGEATQAAVMRLATRF